jgi:hypothetical protein
MYIYNKVHVVLQLPFIQSDGQLVHTTYHGIQERLGSADNRLKAHSIVK